ncbi:MAG TPA: MFS transporter [Thermohalobaculum sp.]|nr:MFS transporter [Thermohalobaculum sp.]
MNHPLARREAVLTCAWYWAVFGAFGAHLPYWPIWLADWGLSEAEVGTYLGMALAVRVVGATLLPAIADRFAIRRAVLTAAALAAAGLFAAHLAIETRPLLLAATLAAAFAIAPLGPLGEALGVRASVMHDFPYAQARALGSAAFLVVSLIMGSLVAWAGTGAVLWAVVLGFLAAAVLGPVHPGGGAPPGAGSDRSRFREALGLLRAPVFLVFAAAASLGQASHAVFYVYGSLAWAGQGIATGIIGALWAVGVVAEIALMLGPGRRIVAWLGPAGAMAVGASAGMLRWVLMSLEPPLALLWPVQAMHALTFALAHLGAMAFVAAAIPPRMQASAQGLYGGGLGGMAFALATLAAGAISAIYGPSGAYWLAASMSAVALAAALGLRWLWDGEVIDAVKAAG